MFLRQHLATKTHDIPLANLSVATEHTEHNGTITHVGWKLKAHYGGSDEKKKNQKYELIFSPEEAVYLRDEITALLSRFEDDQCVQKALAARNDAEVVDDDAE
jgi:hypothetical protein